MSQLHSVAPKQIKTYELTEAPKPKEKPGLVTSSINIENINKSKKRKSTIQNQFPTKKKKAQFKVREDPVEIKRLQHVFLNM